MDYDILEGDALDMLGGCRQSFQRSANLHFDFISDGYSRGGKRPYLTRRMARVTLVPDPNLADGKPVGVSDADLRLKADITYVDAQVVAVSDGPDRNFVFNQVIPAAVWTVNHNLGKFPAVSVVDSVGRRILGDEQHISSNQTVLTFMAEFSGKAYFN